MKNFFSPILQVPLPRLGNSHSSHRYQRWEHIYPRSEDKSNKVVYSDGRWRRPYNHLRLDLKQTSQVILNTGLLVIRPIKSQVGARGLLGNLHISLPRKKRVISERIPVQINHLNCQTSIIIKSGHMRLPTCWETTYSGITITEGADGPSRDDLSDCSSGKLTYEIKVHLVEPHWYN